MISLFIVMCFVFIGYVGSIWIIYGPQQSISESYYTLPRKWNFLFTLFTWGFAFPAIIIGDSTYMFIAGSGIIFVGVAAQMHDKAVRVVHLFTAFTGIIFSQVALIFQYDMWYITVLYAVSIPILYFMIRKYWIWYIEILAFLSICIALAYTLF